MKHAAGADVQQSGTNETTSERLTEEDFRPDGLCETEPWKHLPEVITLKTGHQGGLDADSKLACYQAGAVSF